MRSNCKSISASSATVGMVVCFASLSMLSPLRAMASDFDWGGPYIGITAGLAEERSDVNYAHATRTPVCNDSVSSPNDFGFSYIPACPGNANYRHEYGASDVKPEAGLRIGYNWLAREWVFGLQANAYVSEWSSNSDSRVIGVFQDTLTLNTRQRNVGDLRLLMGRAMKRWVPYISVGVAIARVSTYVNQHSFYYSEDRGIRSFNDDTTLVGYCFGAGLQYALGRDWFVSTDYTHADYGDAKLIQAPENLRAIPYPDTTLRNSVRSDTLRVGISRRF